MSIPSTDSEVRHAWSELLATNPASFNWIIKEHGDPFRYDSSADSLKANYAVHAIRKKNGGSRQIEAPNKDMKRIQRILLSQMKQMFQLHPAAMAVVGKSYVDNASPHVGAKHVFKTDIMDFYPTTTRKKVDQVLKNHFPEQYDWMNSRLALFYYRDGNLLDTRLPTGAPTSPFIGNLVLYGVDITLTDLAEKLKGTYTRYLDDITFSFTRDVDPVEMNDIRNEICAILIRNHWQPHPRKTRWIDPSHDRYTVTGVDVRTEQKVTSKYIRQKVRHLVEHNVHLVINCNYVLPKWIHNRNASHFNKFEDVLPIFFGDSLPILGYIKQVNKEQYSQQVERTRQRLNRICELEQVSLSNFTRNTISKLLTYFHLFDDQRNPQLPPEVKTFDEALVFALQYVLARRSLLPDNRQQDGYPDDDLPF
jgi:hypothetical protein